MTCHDALLLLEFARPGATELDAADIAALETHLANCPACTAIATTEWRGRERLAAALAKVPASTIGPTQLRTKLARQRHRWQLRSALIAAACFGLAGMTWWAIPGPRLDPDAIVISIDAQVGNPNSANTWLASKDASFRFPRRLRGEYLISFEHRNFHGVTTPVLTFVHGNSIAHVAVLTSKQFRNLSDFESGRVAENSSASILILREADLPGVVYVVEIINGPVDAFVIEEKSSAT